MNLNAVRKRRLAYAGLILFGVAVAVAIALTAFQQNLMFFYSPTEVRAGEAPDDRPFRVGGLVEDGSVRHSADGLRVSFSVTDNRESLAIHYTGILPDLFREGQGIVAQGSLRPDGAFVADEVLAKHDENYMPPEVHEALKASRESGTGTP